MLKVNLRKLTEELQETSLLLNDNTNDSTTKKRFYSLDKQERNTQKAIVSTSINLKLLNVNDFTGQMSTGSSLLMSPLVIKPQMCEQDVFNFETFDDLDSYNLNQRK